MGYAYFAQEQYDLAIRNYKEATKLYPEYVTALNNLANVYEKKQMILVDGNYFNPMTRFNKELQKIKVTPHICIEGGDNKYSAIAAASILAKVERDKYIEELCNANPELAEKYKIDSNKGYGSKEHMEGIRNHGITIWHRRTFGICKNYV